VVPWQEIDEGFRRSSDEIIALAEVSTALVEKEKPALEKPPVGNNTKGWFRPILLCRSRFVLSFESFC